MKGHLSHVTLGISTRIFLLGILRPGIEGRVFYRGILCLAL